MDMHAMEKKIDELMMENNITAEWVDYNEKIKMVALEIKWGDWKHDHARMDWLMTENFPNLRSIHTATTEEDGSDCYSAIHHYYFN